VTWSEPQQLNGCPLQEFKLFINQDGDIVETTAAPHINSFTITNFVDSFEVYEIYVEAFTAGGSIVSGTNQMTMANVPD
jgi:hypothetical protein